MKSTKGIKEEFEKKFGFKWHRETYDGLKETFYTVDEELWNWIEKQLTKKYNQGFKHGRKSWNEEVKASMNEWHKHEMTGLEK